MYRKGNNKITRHAEILKFWYFQKGNDSLYRHHDPPQPVKDLLYFRRLFLR
jgi:hypothetical protein